MWNLIKSVSFLLASIILARFILPANFTPLLSMAIFLPFLISDKKLQIILPVAILFITDIIIGFYGFTMLFVYFTIILISIISHYLNKNNFYSLMGTSFVSVILWHLIVNFGVYLNGINKISLLETYALAIPFDLRLLASTLIFSTLFYITFNVGIYCKKYLFSKKEIF